MDEHALYPSPSTQARRLRVLLVEDHEDTAATCSHLLEQWGHDCGIASDGVAALEMAAAFRPDVILLDLGLPRLDGFEVVRRLRQTPDGTAILVWVVSGYAEQPARTRAREMGADIFLAKPVDPTFLSALLQYTAEVIGQAREAQTARLTGSQPNEQRGPHSIHRNLGTEVPAML